MERIGRLARLGDSWTPSAVAVRLGIALLPVVMAPTFIDAFRLPKQVLLLILCCVALGDVRIVPRPPAFRIIAAAVIVAELLAFAVSADPLTSMLGGYATRLGIISHLAVLVLLAAAIVSVRSSEAYLQFARFGLGGLAVTGLYAVIQRLGADPFSWSVPDQVFSTFGNANEFAAFLVLSIALLPASLRVHDACHQRSRISRIPHYSAAVGGLLALQTGVLWTHSRSGLAAFYVALVVTAILAIANGWALRRITLLSVSLTALLALGVGLCLLTGDTETLRQRVEHLAAASNAAPAGTDSPSLRLEIWRGTFAVLRNHPLLGVGQSGIEAPLERERPYLAGRFAERASGDQDYTVDSPHSVILEIPAQLGVAGALAVGLLVGWIVLRYWKALRTQCSSPLLPFLGGGLFGYGAYSMFNPLSLGTVALAALIAGAAAGLSHVAEQAGDQSQRPPSLSNVARGAVLVVSFALGGWLLLVEAVFSSAFKLDGGTEAVDRVHLASSLAPWVVVYRRADVEFAMRVGYSAGNAGLIAEGRQRDIELLKDFPGHAIDYIRVAQSALVLGAPGFDQAIAAAHEASPHGATTAELISDLEQGYRPGNVRVDR